MKKIKRFKDFVNESFLNNDIFNLFGSIIQGETLHNITDGEI
jgi:hypothetical protein